MSIQNINLGTAPSGADGDPVRSAFGKCQNNFVDLDSRATATAAIANAALPVTGGNVTGTINNINPSQTITGLHMINVSGTGIGGSWSDWVTRGCAIQLDCNSNVNAYSLMRASHWGARHLAAIDVYEGGSSTSRTQISFHLGSSTNAFQFMEGGNAWFAGTLSQNSDYRIKQDIVDLSPEKVADSMRSIRAIEYTDTRDATARRVGVIAHELAERFPLLVDGVKDAVRKSTRTEGDQTPYLPGTEPENYVPPKAIDCEEPLLQNVNYVGLVTYLIGAWQHSDAQLHQLQTRISELEAKLSLA
ncbi:tail fiber domain-containing protein [Dyella silvatica]|uniref:tail fiber domain-containing protein n=1 Tax=Dyella silvatica TaxID=2992128 RepID=UPI00225A4036|nr:tail fiber domain-containing protein [Dyella silvatica]